MVLDTERWLRQCSKDLAKKKALMENDNSKKGPRFVSFDAVVKLPVDEPDAYIKPITSPRALQVCLDYGVDPDALLPKPVEYFEEPGLSEALQIVKYQHNEELRQQRLGVLIRARDQVIQATVARSRTWNVAAQTRDDSKKVAGSMAVVAAESSMVKMEQERVSALKKKHAQELDNIRKTEEKEDQARLELQRRVQRIQEKEDDKEKERLRREKQVQEMLKQRIEQKKREESELMRNNRMAARKWEEEDLAQKRTQQEVELQEKQRRLDQERRNREQHRKLMRKVETHKEAQAQEKEEKAARLEREAQAKLAAIEAQREQEAKDRATRRSKQQRKAAETRRRNEAAAKLRIEQITQQEQRKQVRLEQQRQRKEDERHQRVLMAEEIKQHASMVYSDMQLQTEQRTRELEERAMSAELIWERKKKEHADLRALQVCGQPKLRPLQRPVEDLSYFTDTASMLVASQCEQRHS
ncbi:hypothetical protein CYMTET_30501 [Cymbomonas tetramitiformis]|uniref:Uncharacterized protein n=1 Tax=Cymbomonas tetramitiformis TaxID=36881 RepID=A0AAE0FJC4_9CHLO|nr:hypothetical protein CYMTET_30501 [Cymbomonas tetramitiformis]